MTSAELTEMQVRALNTLRHPSRGGSPGECELLAGDVLRLLRALREAEAPEQSFGGVEVNLRTQELRRLPPTVRDCERLRHTPFDAALHVQPGPGTVALPDQDDTANPL